MLEPLANSGLTAVFHNASFDLGHLGREGVPVGAAVLDTMQMLRLIDQDRGGDGADVKTRRRYLAGGRGLNPFTSYRLKDATPRLAGVGMIDFPDAVAALPYRDHVRYLASDLLGTAALQEHLQGRLNQRPSLLAYHDRLCGPITPLLVRMAERGMCLDASFVRGEVGRLEALADILTGDHLEAYGHAITDDRAVARWLWGC